MHYYKYITDHNQNVQVVYRHLVSGNRPLEVSSPNTTWSRTVTNMK